VLGGQLVAHDEDARDEVRPDVLGAVQDAPGAGELGLGGERLADEVRVTIYRSTPVAASGRTMGT
jgi:hypothetical protein